MNELLFAYLKLTAQQRKWIIALSVFALLLFNYLPRYTQAFAEINKARSQYHEVQSRYQTQQKLIKNITAIKTQLVNLEKTANPILAPSQLNKISNTLGLKNFSIQAEETSTSIQFNTTLKNIFSFLNQALVEISSFKLNQLALTYDGINPEAAFEITFNATSSSPENTFNLFAIPAEQTEWLGTLIFQNHMAIAFLKLPDQKIAGISLGGTYGKSNWLLKDIQLHEIKLQEASGKTIIRHIA